MIILIIRVMALTSVLTWHFMSKGARITSKSNAMRNVANSIWSCTNTINCTNIDKQTCLNENLDTGNYTVQTPDTTINWTTRKISVPQVESITFRLKDNPTAVPDHLNHFVDNSTLSFADNGNISNTTSTFNHANKMIRYNISPMLRTCFLACAGIILFFIPFIIVGNIMVVLAVYQHRKLRTALNVLLAFLACFDIIMGFPTIPLYAMYYINAELFNNFKYLCIFRFFSVVFSGNGSINTLMVVSIDRYIAVLHPLKYKRLMTKKRAKFLAIGVTIYATFTAVLPVFFNTWDRMLPCYFNNVVPKWFSRYVSTFILSVSLIISASCYYAIFRATKRHRQRMKKVNVARMNDIFRSQLEKETRTAKIMAVVLVIFIIFWFPFTISYFLNFLLSNESHEIMKTFAITLAMLNSFCNAIIYCWLKKDFRDAFTGMLRMRQTK